MKKLICALLVLLLASCGALSALAGAGAAWTCPACGSGNTGNFCMECGAARPTEIACPACGAAYPADTTDRFCTECGAKLRPDPSTGGFATPEEAAMRYIDGLRQRDLDLMFSAFNWDALETHMTLAQTLKRTQVYGLSDTIPSLPGDGGLLSALNIQQMKSNILNYLLPPLIRFVATGTKGENTLASYGEDPARSSSIKIDDADAFIAQFDMARLDDLAAISDVKILSPEEAALARIDEEERKKQLEPYREWYGADEIRDLAITFNIGSERYVVFAGFLRYGNSWTMYRLNNVSSMMLAINMYKGAFMPVKDLGLR